MCEFKGRAGFLPVSSGVGITGMNTGSGLGFGIWDLGFGIWDLGFGILAANTGTGTLDNLKGSTPECCKQYKSTSFYLTTSDIQVHYC